MIATEENDMAATSPEALVLRAEKNAARARRMAGEDPSQVRILRALRLEQEARQLRLRLDATLAN